MDWPRFGFDVVSNPTDVLVQPGEQRDLVLETVLVRRDGRDAHEHWQPGVVVEDDVRRAGIALRNSKISNSCF